MPLVCSLVLPHGAMSFDGGPGGSPDHDKRLSELPQGIKTDCTTLYQSFLSAAQLAKDKKPDIIFLNTPHGVCLSDHLCVYLNDKAKGNAEWNEQWMEYSINVEMNPDLSQQFLDHLQSDGIRAEGMASFAKCEAPLRWGEVIPLWFFKDLIESGMKVVIFSNPLSRSKPLVVDELSLVGRSVGRFMHGLTERVLYITSGDLAHTHATDCSLPLYLPDPRWNMPPSDTALPFDNHIQKWLLAEDPSSDYCEPKLSALRSSEWKVSNGHHWLSEAMKIKKQARSCGIYGFGILHGVLALMAKEKPITSQVFCRLAPTYYGMPVAAHVWTT